MVLSVQFAADPTSAAAPRTVLQAASARQVTNSAPVTILDFMSTLPYVAETTNAPRGCPLDEPQREHMKNASPGALPARHSIVQHSAG